MGGKKPDTADAGSLPDLGALGASLPTRTRRGKPLRLPRQRASATGAGTKAPAFPACFSEVTRHARSKLPAHARERATLLAVASTIPSSTAAAGGETAAGVYLAALTLALAEVVGKTPTRAGSEAKEGEGKKPKLSRKQRKALRSKQEADVQGMSAMDARAGGAKPDADAKMDAEQAKEAAPAADAEFAATLVYLVGLSARGASRALVSAKVANILRPVLSVLALPGGGAALARHAAGAFAAVLSQLDASAWGVSEVPLAYVALIGLAAGKAPKPRRRAREALFALLRSTPPGVLGRHCGRPAAGWFAREMCRRTAACGAAAGGEDAIAALVHCVNAANWFVPILSDAELAQSAKEIALVLQKDVKGAAPFAYDALAFAFCIPRDAGLATALVANASAPGHAATRERERAEPRLPQKDAERLLAAAVGLPAPVAAGVDARAARARALATMAGAVHVFYAHTPPPKGVTVHVVDALVAGLDPIALAAPEARVQAAALREVLRLRWVRQAPEVFVTLTEFRTVKYKPHWGTVLPLLKEHMSSGAAVAHPRVQAAVGEFVADLVKMRTEAVANAENATISLAEGLLAAAVRGGGTPALLKSAPMRRDEAELLTNAWALPILADNIRSAPLSLWSTTLAPVQQELESAVEASAKKEHAAVEAQNMSMYARQLLSLLPGLCTNPPDLAQAQSMSVAFQAIHLCFTRSEAAVQNYGASALRALAESMLAPGATGFGPGTRASFGSRLKKLFGSVVDLAEKISQDRRRPLLQALTAAARAAEDTGLVVALLRKAIRRFLEVAAKPAEAGEGMEDVDAARAGAVKVRHAASDVAIALVESGAIPQDAQEFSLLKRALLPFLQERTDAALQKKAYRAIAALLAAGAFSTSVDGTKELVDELSKSAEEVAPGAHSARLATVEAIMDMCQRSFEEEEQVELIQVCTSTFQAEAVLALRDTSEKTRQAAASSIVAIGKTWAENSSEKLGIDNYFVSIAAGLGGRTPAMVSASLIAMGHFMISFKTEIRSRATLGALCSSFFAQSCAADGDEAMADGEEDGQKVKELTHVRPGPIAILLRHESLEVQRAAIGVVKVAITVLGSPQSRLLEIMPGFLPSLVATAAESKKREIRLRVKVVLERLLRKCGREVMEARFPEEHRRLLSSVRKQHEKEKAKKVERRELAAMKRSERDGEAAEGMDADDGDGMDFDIDSDSDVENELLDGNEMLSKKKREKAGEAMARQMEEPEGEVYDLLASDSINVAHANKLTSRARAGGAGKPPGKSTGKKSEKEQEEEDAPLVFMESEDDSDRAENGSDAELDEIEALSKEKPPAVVGRKRRRKEADDGGGKKARGNLGEEYRSKRAAGDVKRAGRPDPYAYVPLGGSVEATGRTKKGAKAKRGKKLRLPRKR